MSSADLLLHPRRRFPFPGLAAPVIFLVLTLLLFNDALFDTTKVLAAPSTDLALQFLPWRKFGFDELRHGNLALWNPHIYGGAPYFAGFQSALLYPPNWLHLLMPVGLAINWINALHVFLAGMLTYAWCRYRGITRGGGILAGVMFMFCGPYFPHIYAGHLPHVAIMVWAPLLFLAIDLVMDGLFARGTLLGVFAMTMFLLAGHPQYVYYTGMAAAVYVLINLFRAKNIPFAIAGCATIVAGGVAIAAVQMLSGVDFVSESVRSTGTKYEFSASFSFPPENLLTLLSPDVFGPLAAPASAAPPDAYFGRCYLWEVTLFVSVTGLLLALFGLVATRFKCRRGAGIMVLVCFILALGAHTPLHHFLYDHLPGFASFRGSVKFNYLVALFLSLLAALGFDQLLRAQRSRFALLGICIAMLVVTLTLAGVVRASADDGFSGFWSQSLRQTIEAGLETGDVFVNTAWLGDANLVRQAGLIASHELLVAGGVVFGITALVVCTWLRPRIGYALIGVAMLEMLCYAGSTRETMNAHVDLPAPVAAAIQQTSKDARVLDARLSPTNNFGMWFGYNDVWGYDPGVLKRYAELIFKSQGMKPDDASQYARFVRPDPRIFQLLRVSPILTDNPRQPVQWFQSPMDVAQLVPTAYVIKNRDEILSGMQSDSFDPRRGVFLETAPSIKPAGSFSPGTVQIVSQTTDRIELVADVSANAILLVTNAYSHGWRADAIGPSPQDHYDVLPADWAFQAIPLMAGKHHLLLEYRPGAFVLGKWISILALLGYIAALVWYFRARGDAQGNRADG
jgi:hypothetical protein